MKNEILVVGGAGFIGSHVCVELHNNGYVPIVVDNFSNSKEEVLEGIAKICGKPIKLYKGDACDREFLQDVLHKERNVIGAVHFAAFKAVGESVINPLKYYQNNLGSLESLLSVLIEKEIRNFVFSSSATVYGQVEILPVFENSPYQAAESPYGTTKIFSEKIIKDVVDSQCGLKAVCLRYFNPIGAHPSSHIGELPLGIPNNLVPFITQTAAGIRNELIVFGNNYNTPDGTCIRDYIHVVDLAKAHVMALDYLKQNDNKAYYDVFNIGTGRGNSVLEVIETFQKATGEKLNYRIGERRSGDIESLYANVDKVRVTLGWQANLLLKDALIDAWKWQKSLNNTL